MRRIATALWLVACGVSAGAQTLADRSTATCYSCHDETRRDSHPVQIVYGTKRGLRSASDAGALLVAGRVECVSCHFAHADETTNKYRLRVPSSEQQGYTALCVTCHEIDKR